MASTVTLVHSSPYRVVYTVVEAGTAASTAAQNVVSDLTGAGYTVATSPLLALLNASYGSQAAARTATEDYCDILCQPRALSVATSQLLIDPNVSGTAYRLDMTASKAANGDTATWVVELIYRHSIVS